jgi:hypothetical protein
MTAGQPLNPRRQNYALRFPELLRGATANEQSMVNEEAHDRNKLAQVVQQKDALSVANQTLRKALQDVVNGNDLALARGASIENWRNSAFRKQAVAALAETGE